MSKSIEPLAFRSTIMVVMMKISRLLCVAALVAVGTTASAATLSGLYTLTAPDMNGDVSFNGGLDSGPYAFTGVLNLSGPAMPSPFATIDVTLQPSSDNFLTGNLFSLLRGTSDLELTFDRVDGVAVGFDRRFTVRLFDFFSGRCEANDCTIEVSEAAVIPLPGAMPMLLLGLGAIGIAARRRRAG